MNKILFLFVFLFSLKHSHAQISETPATKLAQHIANKLKDSLELTTQQRAKVFQVNMDLHHKKDAARKSSTDRTIVGKAIQQIERSRDSLYKEVFSNQQYIFYTEKKKNLVTAR